MFARSLLVLMGGLIACPQWSLAAEIPAPKKGTVTIEVAPIQPAEDVMANPLVAPAKKQDAPVAAEKDDDADVGGTVNVKVPGHLLARGWALRVDGDVYELTGDKVAVEANALSTAELLDPGYRVVAVRHGAVDEGLLNDLKPRRWQVRMTMGLVQGDPVVWGDALQTGTFSHLELGVRYQPSRWGFELDFAVDGGSDAPRDDMVSQYSGQIMMGLGAWEFVPFGHRTASLARLHLLALAGLSYGVHTVTITDKYASVNDSSRGMGTVWGAECRYPLLYNFWASVRWLSLRETIRMETVGFATSAPRTAMTFGGAYAF